MEPTKREKRKLRLQRLMHQSQEAQKGHEQQLEHKNQLQEQGKANKPKYHIFAAVVIATVAIAAYFIYSLNKPSQYDDFAKCLNEKGAVMYGAMDWCKYTQAQKAMFGKSFKYINYHEYEDLVGIRKTPTWVISGEWHENVQSFDRLAALTGCKL